MLTRKPSAAPKAVAKSGQTARMCALLLLLLLVVVAWTLPASALNNGLVRVPPRGWMSWMYYTDVINEDIIKGVADEMASGGT